MTTQNIAGALNAMAYIGAEYDAVDNAVPIDEFAVFVGEQHAEVSMHWYFPPSTETIDLAKSLTEIGTVIPRPSSGVKDITAEIVEEENQEPRIDVTVVYPYS